jgi:hypothetical protein
MPTKVSSKIDHCSTTEHEATDPPLTLALGFCCRIVRLHAPVQKWCPGCHTHKPKQKFSRHSTCRACRSVPKLAPAISLDLHLAQHAATLLVALPTHAVSNLALAADTARNAMSSHKPLQEWTRAQLDAEVHQLQLLVDPLQEHIDNLWTQLQINTLYSRVRRDTDLITRLGEDLQNLPAKRRRTTEPQSQRHQQQQPLQQVHKLPKLREEEEDEEEKEGKQEIPSEPRYSIGYAGAQQASFDRLLRMLMHSPTIPPALRLSASSTFLDIGSGVGQCVLHAALLSKAQSCIGIEVVQARHHAAARLLHQLQQVSEFPSLRSGSVEVAPRIQFVVGNAACPEFHPYLFDASHIYLFDKAFMEDTHHALLPLLCRGPKERIVVSCLPPSKLQQRWDGGAHQVNHDASKHFVQLDRITLNTDGNQSFEVSIYRTIP